MTTKEINELFGISEAFEMPSRVMEILQNKEELQRVIEELKSKSNEFDILRDYFQETSAQRSDLKQDYTPDCICEIIGKLAGKQTEILDICSGTGSLSAAIDTDKINYIEFSKTAFPLLLLNACANKKECVAINGDALSKEQFKVFKVRGGNPERIENANIGKYKLVVSNPPYSMPWNPIMDERFFGYEQPPKSKADYSFILDGLSHVSDDGKAFYVLPHGVLFRGQSEGEIRKKLIQDNVIDAVIGLPDKLFFGTQIPTCIVIFNKAKKDTGILFVDGSKLFTKGKKTNLMNSEQIEKIVSVVKLRENVEKLSHVANIDEVRDNDYNLNIPRYVDTSEKEELPSFIEIAKEIAKTDAEIKQTEQALFGMMREFVFADDLAKQEYLEGLRLIGAIL